MVFGHTDDIVDPMSLAPAQHFRVTEPPIATKGNVDVRPRLTQTLDQQRQNHPTVFGTVDIAGTQTADLAAMAAKNIQEHEKVVPIVAMKIPAFLFARNWIIDGVEVQGLGAGRCLISGDELR